MKNKPRSSTPRGALPLCRSELLQDIVIALGRSGLKSIRYEHLSLRFNTQEDPVSGANMERLNLEARGFSGQFIKIAVWEDGVAWVFARTKAGQCFDADSLETHASLETLTPEEIAELLRSTLKDPFPCKASWQKLAMNNKGH